MQDYCSTHLFFYCTWNRILSYLYLAAETGLGLEMTSVSFDGLGLEASGLVNIPVKTRSMSWGQHTGWRRINRIIYFCCDNDGKQAVGLGYSPDKIVHWLKSGLFGGQFSGSTNSDTWRRKNATVWTMTCHTILLTSDDVTLNINYCTIFKCTLLFLIVYTLWVLTALFYANFRKIDGKVQ